MAAVRKAGAAEYAWERNYERSWEAVREEDGVLVGMESGQQRRRRQRLSEIPSVRRGMIRYLFVVIDLSESMRQVDFKPSRRQVVIEVTKNFIHEFFDQNPLSHLGLIVTRNGAAKKLTDLSSNPAKHIAALNNGEQLGPGGDMSMQNGLIVALEQLQLIPNYGNREVVFIHGALSTCDPGDIFKTLAKLKQQKVRVSVVSISAEIFIAKTIAKETGGDFGVCLNQGHLSRILASHTQPPVKVLAKGETEAALAQKLVKMGFPNHDLTPGWCACHMKWQPAGYRCPRCNSKCCDVPTACPICGLHLVSSARLARSYHHLFPVNKFEEVPKAEWKEGDSCSACFRMMTDGKQMRLRCGSCEQIFCFECDVFIHDSLHNCPGCC